VVFVYHGVSMVTEFFPSVLHQSINTEVAVLLHSFSSLLKYGVS
jgi:hypothetical protein